jgi:hypothetical protein
MKNEPNIPDIVIDSILTTKALGSVQDISKELQLPDGKNLEELLNDQKEEEDTKDTK